jgi:hypothetical protein
MQHTTCENMYIENMYSLSILNNLHVFVQYNCINATLYATIANFGYVTHVMGYEFRWQNMSFFLLFKIQYYKWH